MTLILLPQVLLTQINNTPNSIIKCKKTQGKRQSGEEYSGRVKVPAKGNPQRSRPSLVVRLRGILRGENEGRPAVEIERVLGSSGARLWLQSKMGATKTFMGGEETRAGDLFVKEMEG